MELLESKRADAVRALKSLKDIQLSEFSEVTRDAAIQRFEYTVEAVRTKFECRRQLEK